MERAQLAVPEWRQPLVIVPLTQAFPEFGQVKEFRSKQCLFNHDRTKLFNVVSRKYQAIDHGLAVDTIGEALEEVFGDSMKDASLVVRTLAGGARIRAEWKMPFLEKIVVGKGDVIDTSVVMRNSHDGMWRFSASLGTFRQICSNGAIIGQRYGRVSGKHFPVMGKTDTLVEQIQTMIQRSSQLQEEWREWAATPMSLEEAKSLVEDVFPEKYLKPILQEDRFPRSKWDFYNDLTRFATHDTKSVNRRIEFDDLISQIFYG